MLACCLSWYHINERENNTMQSSTHAIYRRREGGTRSYEYLFVDPQKRQKVCALPPDYLFFICSLFFCHLIDQQTHCHVQGPASRHDLTPLAPQRWRAGAVAETFCLHLFIVYLMFSFVCFYMCHFVFFVWPTFGGPSFK